jgi:hypothetical protein
MIRYYILVLFFLLSSGVYSQPSNHINYQAAIIDQHGEYYANKNVDIKISILDSGQTVFYVEKFTVLTDAYGLFNIQIGNGLSLSGSYDSIDWSTSKWQKTEIDTLQNGSYSLIALSEFLAVPYALYARFSGNEKSFGTEVCNLTANVVHFAASDGFLVIQCNVNLADITLGCNAVIVHVDSIPNPILVKGICEPSTTITIPVKKGYYWKVEETSCPHLQAKTCWMPLE